MNSIFTQLNINRIRIFFSEGHERSIRIKKNIFASIIIKLTSILIGLILIPLTIHYVDKSNYGIWLTISSLVGWMSYFDIGLNNGLRNKFGQAKALNNISLAKKYVSTTYALLTLIFIPLIIIFSIINGQLHWTRILKLSNASDKEIGIVILIVFSYFCIKFILSTINTILMSDQKPAGASLLNLLEQMTSLIIIFILTRLTKGSLLNLCIGLCIAPLFLFLSANILLFSKKYKDVSPEFSEVDFKLSRDLLGLGLKFFLLQIAVLVQFQTSNIIIIRSFGASEVTSYNIAYKYFNMLSMALAIIITPFWSAVTDAMMKNEVGWIKNSVRRYQRIVFLIFIMGIIMLAFSHVFYTLWLGKGTINISFMLSVLMFLYVCSTMVGRVYGMVLNGIGALRIQIISAFISPILFLLLCYLFINNMKLGLYSVVIAGILTNFGGAVLAPIQYRQIFILNKKGIWIK